MPLKNHLDLGSKNSRKRLSADVVNASKPKAQHQKRGASQTVTSDF